MAVVSWGKGARYKFIAAGELLNFTAPQLAVVYAITYKQDPSSRPKSHTVLYFGHTDDFSVDMPSVHTDIENIWLESGGSMKELYIFVHPMPGTTRQERRDLQEKLVLEYSPKGNN